MQLISDLSFFSLDEDTVIFSETAQGLIGLNHLAADLVQALRGGHAPEDLASELAQAANLSRPVAETWVKRTLDALASHGFIEGTPPPTRADIPSGGGSRGRQTIAKTFNPIEVRHYRLLNSRIAIRFGDRNQIRLVESVIGHLADTQLSDEQNAPADSIIDLPARRYDEMQIYTEVLRDGVSVGHANQLSFLGPAVKTALWEVAINAFDFLFLFHAGVVGAGDRCILLPAPSGSGKSTLTAALVDAGFSYLSDEMAALDRCSMTIPPVPLAVCVKNTGWEMMARYFPQLAGLPTHRRSDRKIVRYAVPSPDAIAPAPLPVSHVIFPKYQAGAVTTLHDVPRAEALGQLMDECLAVRQRLDPSNVKALIDWIGGVSCHRLEFSSTDEAILRIRELI